MPRNKKPVKIVWHNLKQGLHKLLGKKLIDVTVNDTGPNGTSCVDDSEELVLLFENGHEIEIYFLRGDIVAEED